jgi:signal transduction histidine kinase
MPTADIAAPQRPQRGRRRLRTRIIVSFVLLGFGLTALFAYAMLNLRNRLENQLIEKTLQREVASLVHQVEKDPDSQPYFLMFDARTFSDDNAYKINPLYRRLEKGVHEIREEESSGRVQVYKVAVLRGRSQTGKSFTSLVRYNVTDAAATSDLLTRWLLLAVLVFSLLALLIGWWSASRVMAPVSDLAQRLRRSGNSSAPEALAPNFPDDEVGELAKALDDYAARLTEVVQRDREFNADVSHELRTPLAVIRGAVELLLARPELDERTRTRLARIQRAEQQCTDLIGALLLLSRNERAVGQCDVVKVAQQQLDSHRAQLGGKPVELKLEGAPTLSLEVPDSALAVALGNLIGNAVKYTPSGEVVVRVLADAVEVIDSGPGLSEEDAAKLFTRGYRGTHAGHSQGGGIGLSIVRRLCALYGWDVRVRPGDTQGVVATLTFG